MSRVYDYNILDKNQFPRGGNLFKDHEDSNHVCMMKLFPTCGYDSKHIKDHQIFHLRFYLPKKAIVNKEQKIERIIVMINGLDEVDYFTLYDQLGQKFAEYNLASVLLPLPDHLNRHPRFRLARKEDTERPSSVLREHPEVAFERYLQTMEELGILVDHLHYKGCKEEESNCSFFKNYFEPQVRISCLGYSLGALVALSSLINSPDKYNACFLLNGGIQLRDLKFPPEFIPQDMWDKFVSDLEDKWEMEISRKQLEEPQISYWRYFNRLFLGNFSEDLKQTLKDHARRILLIIGGKDRMIPYDSIQKLEPKEHGLSIFKIPGLGHFLPIEKEWSKWLDIVATLINSFEENATYELLTPKDITEGIIKLDRKYQMFERNSEFLTKEEAGFISSNFDIGKISVEADKKLAEQLFFASFAYYNNKEDLVKDLNKEYSRNFTGRRAVEKGYVKREELEEAIRMKKEYPEKKIGEILVERMSLGRHQLDEILQEQKGFTKTEMLLPQ